MVQRRPTAAALDNNYQVDDDHEPMYFLGMRVRHWARRVVMPIVTTATFIGIWAHSRPNDFQFDFFKSAPNTANVAALQKMSKLLFNVDYSYGSNAKLDQMARNDKNLDRSEAATVMMSAYDKDTLTTQQVYDERSMLKAYFEPARDSAVEMLKNDLDINELVPKTHRITSHYGPRTDPFDKTKKQKHGGIDLKFAAFEPISSNKDLIFVSSQPTRSGLNMTTVMDGKYKLEIIHVAALKDQNEFGIEAFKPGDKIPANTPFAMNDGRVGKKYRTTGTNTHIQAKVKNKKGVWVSTNPTQLAKQFMTAPGFTANRMAVSQTLATLLGPADGFDFDDVPNVLDEMRANGKLGKKALKRLTGIYASYSTTVEKRTDSLIRADIDQDREEMALAFLQSVEEQETTGRAEEAAKEAVEENYADLIRNSEHKVAASLVGTLEVSSKVKAEEEVAEAANTAKEEITTPSGKSVWKNLSFSARKADLYERLVDRPRAQQYAPQADMTAEELANDLIVLSIDHERSGLKPDVAYGDYGKITYRDKNGKLKEVESDAEGLWQLMGETRGEKDPNNKDNLTNRYKLPKWPDKSLLGTDKGLDIQGDYALSLWHSNLQEARKRDEESLKENGVGLYDKVYITADGTPHYITYRTAASGSWCGADAYNDKLEAAQKKAKKDGAPFAKLNMYVSHQNFSNYAKIGKDSVATAREQEALAVIAADSSLQKYYKHVPKKSKKKNAVAAVSHERPALNDFHANNADVAVFMPNLGFAFVATTSGTIPKYEYSLN